MPDAELAASTVENVRVVVRVRPMDQREKLDNSYNCVSVDSINNTIAVTRNNVNPPEPPRIYAYDAVFDSNTSQMDIYVQTASPIVEEVLKGYNGTIFAYGQTGTGKTYTMAGSNSAPELRGIIPNSFAHIFSHIAKAKDDEKFLVCVTYLEIYNEEVRDLLGNNPHQSLEVKERPDIGVFVKDLTGYVVHNADELEKIMAVGNKNRHIGATAMNTESSRSHAIFCITVESSKKGADGKMHVKMGKLHLVDLAGSERQSKTQATGTRLKEATKINQSLSVLGNVISALVDGKSTHIPYRNSKLTRLLQDSLGGNSKTVMIATIGPAECNYVETISTLRYANRAKNIENKTHVNSEPGDALLTRFQQEIDQLKKQLEETTNELEEEGEEEEELSEAELSDDISESELESLDPEDRKMRKREMREQKAKLNREKAHQARKVLEEKKAELLKTKKQQEELKEKLQRLESKVLVGGENLLDKADSQRRLLEQAASELELRKLNELRLQEDLQKKEAERLDLEERYSSLQEENAAKSRKLKRAVQLLNSAKAELADQQREQQREMEGILDSVRALKRELQLAERVLDSYIPKEYQALIEQYVHWNEQLGEWQVKCVAYTGNNMSAPAQHNAHAQKHLPQARAKVDTSPPVYNKLNLTSRLPGWSRRVMEITMENMALLQNIKRWQLLGGKVDSRWDVLPPPVRRYYQNRVDRLRLVHRENQDMYRLIADADARVEKTENLRRDWKRNRSIIVQGAQGKFVLFPPVPQETIEDPAFVAPAGVKRPRVYLTLRVKNCAPMGELTVELFTDWCPQNCRLFTELMDGDGLGYGYVGTTFFRKVPNLYWSGGDVIYNNGFGCYAQKGRLVPIGAENYHFSHSIPGLVSMRVTPDNEMCGIFNITFKPMPQFDLKNVVIGRVVRPCNLFDSIRGLGSALCVSPVIEIAATRRREGNRWRFGQPNHRLPRTTAKLLEDLRKTL